MAHKAHTVKPKAPTLDIGYWVAVVLPAGTAPLRCYVGEVQAVDSQGIRLTLVDWLTNTADSWDLFVPWHHVEAALIATPAHDLTYFFQQAALWQERMKEGGVALRERSAESG